MDEFWGVTILLFIVLTCFVAVIIRMTNYFKSYNRVRHRRVLLSETPLKSGDIVLFVAQTHGLTNSILTNDLYSHAGVVVCTHEGATLLSESTLDVGPGVTDTYPGSRLNDLHSRLSNYPGVTFLLPLQSPLTAKQEDVLRSRARKRTPYPGALQMLGSLLRLPVERRSRHCMQHVAWLLDEAGLTPDRLAREKRTLLGTGFLACSRAVTELSGQPLGGGVNRYAPIVRLVCA